MNYTCTKCAASEVKLWRQYQTLADYVRLLCLPCAEADQGQTIDLAKTDQCGWLVPAVPVFPERREGDRGEALARLQDAAEDTFWGYSSCPSDAVKWWRSLPDRPSVEGAL